MATQRNDYISVSEAAKELGVSGRRVRTIIASGKLPAQMISGVHVIRRADLHLARHDRRRDRRRGHPSQSESNQ